MKRKKGILYKIVFCLEVARVINLATILTWLSQLTTIDSVYLYGDVLKRAITIILSEMTKKKNKNEDHKTMIRYGSKTNTKCGH